MLNKDIKKMFLFIILCILLIGIVSATDVESNDTSDVTPTISEKTTENVNTVDEVKDNVINDNKEIIKKDSKTDNVKTASNQIATKISIDYVPNVSVDGSVYIIGTFTDINNNPLRYTHLKVDVNGEAYYSQTDNYGEYIGEYFATTPGTKTITVSWAGNTRYAATTSKRTFNVEGQYPTQIVLNNIKDVNQGDTVTISGHYYYDQNKPLRLTTMTLNINGVKYYAKTDNNGYFTYNHKTNKAGTNTVTVTYPGNTRFKAATTTKTFNVKSTGPQYTYITLNNIKEVNLGEITTISGHYYYDQAKPLRLTTMTLNINGAKYYAKTDNNGYFTYNHKTTKTGTNTVTVTYPGNTNFQSATTTKTFNVKSTGPQYTYITLNNIPDTKLGNTATISGYYYYNQNKPLRLTTMTLNINGAKYYAKTDNNGYFTYNHKTTKTGTNTVTVTYPGNANFQSATTTKTFKVNGKSTIIGLYSIDSTKYSDYAKISGYFVDSDWNNLRYTGLTVTINGNKYTTRTDEYGDFTYNYKTNKVGTNTVTVSFAGNDKYLANSTTKTFTVTKKDTVISLNSILTVRNGEYTTISGDYTDIDGNPLKATTITLNINGAKYYAKTDSYGYFYYNYKTNKAGTNTVTASYGGTNNYYGDTISKSFSVTSATSNTKTIIIDAFYTGEAGIETYIDNDIITCTFETEYESQSGPGVWVELRNRNAEYLDDLAPTNRIISVKFYFVNYYDGKVKTKTVHSDYLDYVSTSIPDGCYPTKAEVTYRKMTTQETNEWYNQFY